MHIAICDDNIADRKHLERLLSRESDKRMGTPNLLYVDSFGDKEHFLFNPLLYDLVFMDMSSTPTLTEEILTAITEMGFCAPIVLYSSKIDYSTIPGLPDNAILRKKPYTPDQLPDLLALGDTHVKGHIERIAVHAPGGDVQYLPVRDILYYLAKDSSHAVYLQNGDIVEIAEEAGDFQRLTEPYKEFYRLNQKTVISMRFVSMISPITVMMQDYKAFRISPFRFTSIKFLKAEIDDD